MTTENTNQIVEEAKIHNAGNRENFSIEEETNRIEALLRIISDLAKVLETQRLILLFLKENNIEIPDDFSPINYDISSISLPTAIIEGRGLLREESIKLLRLLTNEQFQNFQSWRQAFQN